MRDKIMDLGYIVLVVVGFTFFIFGALGGIWYMVDTILKGGR
jgi:hypothetical protein